MRDFLEMIEPLTGINRETQVERLVVALRRANTALNWYSKTARFGEDAMPAEVVQGDIARILRSGK